MEQPLIKHQSLTRSFKVEGKINSLFSVGVFKNYKSGRSVLILSKYTTYAMLDQFYVLLLSTCTTQIYVFLDKGGPNIVSSMHLVIASCKMQHQTG